MAHATQMAAARQGVLTTQMQQVLAAESIHESDLIERVAAGRIVIPANRNHPSLIAKGIG
ncbi:MAG: phosphomethylpyrimidine synthase ThiC, partial [Desulfobulbaceae bacterium]|nr:phosphomethylpyrimidine synthase ThiC [Desulfobulbaceae bacterium]